MSKPGDKIEIEGRTWEYPKLMTREETMRKLKKARKEKILTPGLKVVDPDTKKIILEAGYDHPNSPKEVIKKIVGD